MNKSKMKYKHGEAFALMQYQNQRTGEIEVIWNSRDGVTPYCIMSRFGNAEMRHINIQADICSPTHHPTPGNRIFINLTPSLAIDIAREYVNKNWDGGKFKMKDHPFYECFSVSEAVGYYACTIVADGTRPYLFTVTEKWIKESVEMEND